MMTSMPVTICIMISDLFFLVINDIINVRIIDALFCTSSQDVWLIILMVLPLAQDCLSVCPSVMHVLWLNSTLFYLTVLPGWAGSYTCPALRPYQFSPMRVPECNHKVTGNG